MHLNTYLAALTALGAGAAAQRIVYVDCSASGTGNGSLALPYTTLAAVNALTFAAGDALLFKSGVNCTGQLYPKGSGAAGRPVTVSRYGAGALPVLNAEGKFNATVYLLNADHWTISDLHLTNPAPQLGRFQGIDVEAHDGQVHAGITLRGLVVDGVAGQTNKRTYSADYSNAACVLVQGSANGSRYDDVTVADNALANCGGGGIKVRVGQLANHGLRTLVRNNTITGVGGDGIVVSYGDAPLIDYNVAGDLGRGAYPYSGGNFAGIWVLGSHDAVMRYNVVYGSVMSEIDSEAFDCDWGNTGTCTVEYNYSRDNAGGMFLNCDGCGTAPGGATQVVRYNIFAHDCRIFSNGDAPTLWFYNNVVYCPDKDLEIHLPPATHFWNNIVVATENSTLPVGARLDYRANLFEDLVALPPALLQGSPRGDPTAGFVHPNETRTALDGVAGYQLSRHSAALGGGVVVPDNGGRDFWGTPVDEHHRPNIGAYAGRGVGGR